MRSPAATLSTAGGNVDDLLLNSSSARFDSSIPSLSSIKYDSMPSLATMSSRDGCRPTEPNSGLPNSSFDSSAYIWYDDLDEDDDVIVPAASKVTTTKKKISKAMNPSKSPSRAAKTYEDINVFTSPTAIVNSNTRKSFNGFDLVKLNSPPEANTRTTSCRWN